MYVLYLLFQPAGKEIYNILILLWYISTLESILKQPKINVIQLENYLQATIIQPFKVVFKLILSCFLVVFRLNFGCFKIDFRLNTTKIQPKTNVKSFLLRWILVNFRLILGWLKQFCFTYHVQCCFNLMYIGWIGLRNVETMLKQRCVPAEITQCCLNIQ